MSSNRSPAGRAASASPTSVPGDWPLVRLFGGPVLQVAGRDVSPGPQMQARVLAALAVDVGAVVLTDTLVDRVWGVDAPATARRSLQAHLTRLRRTLADATSLATVTRRGSGYVLDADPVQVDVHLFRTLRDRAVARDCSPDDASVLLERALALWSGPAFAGIGGEWAERARDALEIEAVDTAVAWGRATLAIGDHDRVVHRMRGLVAAHPLVEPLAELLILALHGAGRGAEAVETYLAARERLVGELGMEPGQPLRDLYEAVLRDDLTSARPARTQPSSPASTPGSTSGPAPADQARGLEQGPHPIPASTDGADGRSARDGWAVDSTVVDRGGDTATSPAVVPAVSRTGESRPPATAEQSPGPDSSVVRPRPARSSWRRGMVVVGVCVTIVALTGLVASLSSNRRSPVATANSPSPIEAPREPVATEEFTGSVLSATHWGTYEMQRANGSAWSSSAVQVQGGELQIAGAGKDPTGKGNVAGGACWCKPASPRRTYGVWEASVKFDVGAGYGAMIGLWPDGSDGHDGFLTLARLDEPDRRHAYPVVRGRDGTTAPGPPVAGDFTDWNTYSIEWRPSFVEIRLNGRTIFDTRRRNAPVAIPTTPMYLYVQVVPGPDGPIPAPNTTTPDRVVLHVDWVRYSP